MISDGIRRLPRHHDSCPAAARRGPLNVTGAVITMGDNHDRDSALRALATLSQANRALGRETDEDPPAPAADVLDIHRADGPLRPGLVRPPGPRSRAVGRLDRPSRRRPGLCRRDPGLLGRRRSAAAPPAGRCAPAGPRASTTSPGRGLQPVARPATGTASARPSPSPSSSTTIDGALMVYATEPGAFDALAQELLENLVADLGYGRWARPAHHRRRGAAPVDPRLHARPVRHPRGRPRRVGDVGRSALLEANDAAIAYNRVSREEFLGTTVLTLSPGHWKTVRWRCTSARSRPVSR